MSRRRQISDKSIEGVCATVGRPNKYAGPCIRCHGAVGVGEGKIAGLTGRRAWAVEHLSDCQTGHAN